MPSVFDKPKNPLRFAAQKQSENAPPPVVRQSAKRILFDVNSGQASALRRIMQKLGIKSITPEIAEADLAEIVRFFELDAPYRIAELRKAVNAGEVMFSINGTDIMKLTDGRLHGLS